MARASVTDRRRVVAFVVAGGPGSAMAERARSFAGRLGGDFDSRLVCGGGGRLAAASWMLRRLFATGPDLCYVLDIAAAGVACASAYRAATGVPLILDTGDAVVELGRALGRGPLAMMATRGLEAFAMRAASRVVVRGSRHRELLALGGVRAEFIPDGVDLDEFGPPVDAPARPPGRPFTIGLVGTCVWSPARRSCYGWELVELIRLLRDRQPGRPCRGVMVGDGPGIEGLRRRADESGVGDLVEFAGRVPYAELPGWLRRFDACLSTQTDDVIGAVRTTGKLPLYLAAGRFVLASRVGEAARVLPPEMLVEYRGEHDPWYPARLADRLAQLWDAGTDFDRRPECVALARTHFDYDGLAPRVAGLIREALADRRRRSP